MRLPTLFAGIALTLLIPASAATAVAEAGSVQRNPEGLTFETAAPHGGAVLTVTGPEGFRHRQRFEASSPLRFDLPAAPADGYYRFELRFAPVLDEATRASLSGAGSGEEARSATLRRLQKEGKVPSEPRMVSGGFTLRDGQMIRDDLEEEVPGASEPAAEGAPLGASAGSSTLNRLHAADQVINDDLIVTRNLCVGLSCFDGQSFGADSLRIQEANTRLRFFDVSTGNFPGNDWQLTANDTFSGGANRFSINDSTAGTAPFTLEAGAGNHAIYVDDRGRVGFGTSAPTAQLHIVDGIAPTLHFEQDNSQGLPAAGWSLSGNAYSFNLRSTGTVSTYPLRVQAAAPNNSLYIEWNGDVGMRTSDPEAALEVYRGGEAEAVRDLLQLTNNGRVRWRLQDTSPDGQTLTVRLAEGDLDFSFSGTAGDQVEMKSNGNMVIQGTLTEMSDRSRKTGITPVEPGEILEKVLELPIAHWRQRDGDPGVRHLGPMAQDFHALFGLGVDDRHIATIDTSGVALAAIQGLHRELEERQVRVEALEEQNRELIRRLEALEGRLIP